MRNFTKPVAICKYLPSGKTLPWGNQEGSSPFGHYSEEFGVYKSNHSRITRGGSNCLFLIDPQNDFIIDSGSLQVAGALDDSKRTASFIMKNLNNFNAIYVSLDTHLQFHIAHKAFWHKLVLPVNAKKRYDWSKAEKQVPVNFEQIPNKAVKDYIVIEGEAIKFVPRDEEFESWAIEYTEKLEKGSETDGVPGALTLTIWPDHCLIGSRGHNVQDDIFEALQTWERVNQKSVIYVLKGNNSKTEHYSALKAEVEVVGDPATKFNEKLYKSLIKHSKIYIGGQARSHCVNFTTRHLVSRMKKDKVPTSKVVLLEGSMSDVYMCEAIGELLVKDMKEAGVGSFDISDIKPVDGDWAKNPETICEQIDDKFDLSNKLKPIARTSKSKTSEPVAKDSKGNASESKEKSETPVLAAAAAKEI